MATFTDYVEKSFEGMNESKLLYRFKQVKIAEMTERANEIISAGLKDNKVLSDLIISEYPDLKGEFKKYIKQLKSEKKKQKKSKLIASAAVCYILALTLVYLAVSFTGGLWSKTWLIMVGGIVIPLVIVTVILISKASKSKDVFTPGARLLIFSGVYLLAAFVFLCLIMLTEISKAYLVFIGAVAVAMIADAAFAFLTKQKFAIFTYLLYIPAVASVVYVLTCLMGILSWHPGWLIIVAALIADVSIITLRLIQGSKYDEEVDVWNED